MSGPTGWEDEPAPEGPAEEPRELYYGSLPEFMRDFFVPMFPRDVTQPHCGNHPRVSGENTRLGA